MPLPTLVIFEKDDHRSSKAMQMRKDFATDEHRLTQINAKTKHNIILLFIIFLHTFICVILCVSVAANS